MSEHTKGPWHYEASIPAQGVNCWWITEPAKEDGARPIVASVDGPQTDETQARARLIAAAPALLDALEDAVGDLETFIDLRASQHSDFCDLARYKAAIAKARGQ